MKRHEWRELQGGLWQCADCPAQMRTASGVHPDTVRPRGPVAPFDPCVPERLDVFKQLKVAEAKVRHAVAHDYHPSQKHQ